jgi:Transposase DDE domain
LLLAIDEVEKLADWVDGRLPESLRMASQGYCHEILINLKACQGTRPRSTADATRHQGCHPAKIKPQGQTASRLRTPPERNLVERFFNNIKHYRGIATCYEKTARNFLAGLQLVCALTWLK